MMATCEEEVTIKAEQCQEEISCAGSKRKRIGDVQQKMHSKLSYQDRCYSPMTNYFIFSLACPPFVTFRDDSYSQIMNTVAGVNTFKKLSIPHLKVHLNSECNAFKKAAKR